MTWEGVGTGPDHLLHVITGLVPVIPIKLERRVSPDRDGRDKPGHDREKVSSPALTILPRHHRVRSQPGPAFHVRGSLS